MILAAHLDSGESAEYIARQVSQFGRVELADSDSQTFIIVSSLSSCYSARSANLHCDLLLA